MSDLTIQYFWHCTTADNWSVEVPGSNGTTYRVAWNRHAHHTQDAYQFDYSCTCKAYEFGKGSHCKHITAVKAQRCGWMAFHDAGEPSINPDTGELCCPQCGEGLNSCGWGV